MTPFSKNPKAKGRLLIIDDEAELREVLIALLENSADEIVQAANGEEGVKLLQSQKFDTVLSDQRMPKKSGLEALNWMRENGIQTPFIIHTGYGQKDMIQEAQRLGVYAFIDKPWDERALIRIVEEALRSNLHPNNSPRP